VATTCSSVIGLLAWLFKRGDARIQKRDLLLRALKGLAADEKAVLKEHRDKGMKSMMHSFGNGAAMGLVRKGVMYIPSPVHRPGSISINVTDEAWDLLCQHPELLE
jgi:hypothetical protein